MPCANVMGRDVVFVTSRFPVEARTKRLLRAAEIDDGTALGLELYNTMGAEDARDAAEALREYRFHVRAAPKSTFSRRARDAVNEATRIKAAWRLHSEPDYQPFVVGLSLRRLLPPKSVRDKMKRVGKQAYKVSRHPALPAVAALVPGVGPGLAAGLTTYQAAMYAVDKAKQGDAQAAINFVAQQAAAQDPRAAEALANIRKGAAIVKDIQKMEVPSGPALQKLIAERAGVDVKALAAQYGIPPQAVTSAAISKVAKGQWPQLAQVLPTQPRPAAPAPAPVPAPVPSMPAAPRSALLRRMIPARPAIPTVPTPGYPPPGYPAPSYPPPEICRLCQRPLGVPVTAQPAAAPVRRRRLFPL